MGFQRKRQLNQYTNLLNEFQDVSRSFKQYLETSDNTTAVTYMWAMVMILNSKEMTKIIANKMSVIQKTYYMPQTPFLT